MNAAELRGLITDTMKRLEQHGDELRDLDAAIGDGDLGITITAGSRAVVAALAGEDGATPALTLRAMAKAFAAANPSTMAALVATGLLAAAKVLGDTTEIDRASAIALADAAATAISARGGARLGDKTLLDALLPSIDALRAADPDPRSALDSMVAAAAEGVLSTTQLQSQRGRAAWVGERSIGHPDGGATAYLRLVEALRDAWPSAQDASATGR
jgi:phosphoenolpyruvate---glycerone phosphotransferase subunit DhaL